MMSSFGVIAGDSLIRTDDFLVRDAATGSSEGVQFAALPDGGFVAVWHDYALGMQGRFCDADGNPVGPAFPDRWRE